MTLFPFFFSVCLCVCVCVCVKSWSSEVYTFRTEDKFYPQDFLDTQLHYSIHTWEGPKYREMGLLPSFFGFHDFFTNFFSALKRLYIKKFQSTNVESSIVQVKKRKMERERWGILFPLCEGADVGPVNLCLIFLGDLVLSLRKDTRKQLKQEEAAEGEEKEEEGEEEEDERRTPVALRGGGEGGRRREGEDGGWGESGLEASVLVERGIYTEASIC